jgi:predicted dehydrogenase
MDKKLRWGVLGTANIAKKAVIPGIIHSKSGDLFAIAGRKKEKTDEFSELFKPERRYYSYEELLNDKDVEAVYIPLPNALHLEWVQKALESGKHVLCEKPIGLNESEVKKMFETSERERRVLIEAFAYIHSPLIKEVKQVIESGEVGEVRSMTSTFTFDLTQRPNDIRWVRNLGGGAMYDLGCYTLHLSRFLSGKKITDVKSTLLKCDSDVDMSTSYIITFEDGIHAISHVSFNEAFSMKFEVIGTKGSLITPYTFNGKGNLVYRIRKGNELKEVMVECPDNYMLEIDHFSEVVDGVETGLLSAEDSIENATIINKILKNY